MQKHMTITLDEAALEAGYKAMAADEAQEKEAQEWINAVVGDIPNESWQRTDDTP